MSIHTPGPWFDDGYRIYAPTESDDKRDGRMIVEYKHVEDFNLADAPLMTAAPDLLAACEAIIAACDNLADPNQDRATGAELVEKAKALSYAAIAKAKGAI